MRAFIYAGQELRETTSCDDVRAAYAAGELVWVDLQTKTPETEALLEQTFALHRLTIDDIWSERASPRVEEFAGYLYLLIHAVTRDEGASVLRLRELDVVIGKSFVITHDQTGDTCHQLRDDLIQNPRAFGRGAPWLVYLLLDRLVDEYLPVIDRFDEDIEVLENDVLDKAGTKEGGAVLSRILALKRGLQSLRRVSIHQREVLLRLARGEFELLPEEMLPYFRNVHDHFVRVGDLADSYRDLVTSALEAYLSVQSNRMNQVMKALALISTIMLPLTFIAGVYGMNFDDMPELHWVAGYPFAIGLMVAVGGSAVLWFRHKGWLD
jgi:magnesium transporter